MHQIQIDFTDLRDTETLFELAKNNEEIDIIQEKNFNGDLTTIELYISMAINVITLLVPVLKSLIKHNKVSSLVIDGDKIELKNISEKTIEKVLEQKLSSTIIDRDANNCEEEND